MPHEAAGGSILGQFLAALFGYTSTPEVVTFVVWLTYVVVVLTLFLRPVKRRPIAAPAPTPVSRLTRERLFSPAGAPDLDRQEPELEGQDRARGRAATPSRPNRKIVPTNRLKMPATAPIADVEPLARLARHEADRAEQHDREVRHAAGR